LIEAGDWKLLYLVVYHELVHVEDFLNGNVDLWKKWYNEQEILDIGENHAYGKSNPIAEQLGLPKGTLPALPSGFHELTDYRGDW
jgi:hypothetical protein